MDIVPTGKDGPAVLGPVDLKVEAGGLDRVFAVGDPAKKTMNVAVHVIPTGSTGSDKPARVNTGTGGQAVGYARPHGAARPSLSDRVADRRDASIVALIAGLTAGCASGSGQTPEAGSSASAAVPVDRPASTRITFIPEQVILPGGSTAAVRPASTVDGQLVVPENVRHVGWWDGSASVGDPYGSTVIAGHVDSATGGLGYFARLLSIRKGNG